MSIILNGANLKYRRRGLRKILPDPERELWIKLRNRQLNGYKFRRQYSVESYVVDFYCPKAKLAIEIDGENHFREKAKTYDRNRQYKIKLYGISMLRFKNKEVLRNIDKVLVKIYEALNR